jgi:hypothetical protein
LIAILFLFHILYLSLFPLVRAPGASVAASGSWIVESSGNPTIWVISVGGCRSANNSDGCRTRPFAALSDLILHYLTLAEFLEGHASDFRMMEEQFASFSLDEPKTSI